MQVTWGSSVWEPGLFSPMCSGTPFTSVWAHGYMYFALLVTTHHHFILLLFLWTLLTSKTPSSLTSPIQNQASVCSGRAASWQRIRPGRTQRPPRVEEPARQRAGRLTGLVIELEHTSQVCNVRSLIHTTRAEPWGCAAQRAKHRLASFWWEQTVNGIRTQAASRAALLQRWCLRWVLLLILTPGSSSIDF